MNKSWKELTNGRRVPSFLIPAVLLTAFINCKKTVGQAGVIRLTGQLRNWKCLTRFATPVSEKVNVSIRIT